MTDRIPVGFVVRAHGIRGEVLVTLLTDNPGRFVPGARFTTDRGPEMLTVTEVRRHKEGILLRLDEVADRTTAEALARTTLTIDAGERRPLEEGEYWPDDLVGLVAVAPDGAVLGRVTDVILGAAQDRLVVTTAQGGAVEVPFVSAIVGEPGGGRIPMSPPEGLFADDTSAEIQGDA